MTFGMTPGATPTGTEAPRSGAARTRDAGILVRGSQRFRDAGVLALLLLGLAPLWLLWPLATAGSLMVFLSSWVALFLTRLPDALLRRTGDSAMPAAGDSIAVLAGGFQADGALSARSLRRLRHGLRLGGGAAVYLCGGARSHGRSEADALRAAAVEAGFGGALVCEDRSRTTVENLLALRELVGADDHAGRLLLVTCPQHAPRLRRLCRQVFAETPAILTYPVDELPGGVRGRAGLAMECLYEAAIHLFLTLRAAAVALRIVPPLRTLRRDHLSRP